jgi:hypothetical protein
MSDTARPKSAGDLLSADEINKDLPVLVNAGESIAGATLPVAGYIDNADGEGYNCDANDLTKLNFVGFFVSTSTDGNPIQLQKNGIVSGFSALTINALYYVQDDGTIGTTPGTYIIPVGRAISSTQIQILHWPKFRAGVVADLDSTTSGTTNNDVTVDLGFKPRMIKIHYYLQGVSGGSYIQKIGIVVFEGTVLKFNNLLNSLSAPSGDNAVENLETNKPNDVTTPLQLGSPGATGVGQKIEINSISETGFVIRRERQDPNTTSLHSRVKISFEAFE